jgi:hypothetical protein
VFTLAIVVVLGLAAGVLIWAPWVLPPVLRPTGLAAGPATVNSIALRWSRPPTGPLPDKYLILDNGRAAGTVPGTVTSYRQADLDPASAYYFRVVAVRGGARSPQSALLTVSTLTPPISRARLQGPWSVYITYPAPAGRRDGSMYWQLSPACAAGACDVTVHGQFAERSFRAKLTRAGGAYRGRTVINGFTCGPGADAGPDPLTLTIRIHITAARGHNHAWTATSFAGTMVQTFQLVSFGTFYCRASTSTGFLSS